MKKAVIGLVLLSIAPLANAEGFLDKLNKGLKQASGVLSGDGKPARSAGPSIPKPTEAQMQKLAKLVVNPVVSSEAKPLWDTARDRIAEVLLYESCYPQYGSHSYLGRYVAPGVDPVFVFNDPIFRMQYHPKTECVTVDRIDDVKMKAKNAISFRVIFVSDASGETETYTHHLTRQPDDQWLFTRR